MSIHKFPAEKITPLDEALTRAINALSEVVNNAEIGLLRDSEDTAWFKSLRHRTQDLLHRALKLRADLWIEQTSLPEQEEAQPAADPKYEVGQIVKVNGWGSSSVGRITDVKSIYHVRLGEYTWGYQIDYKGGGVGGFTFEYVPEVYLEAQ